MHLVIGAAGYAGRHAVAALRESVLVQGADLSDDLAGAMEDVDVVHLAFELHSPLGRPRGRPPHPLLAWLVRLARDAGVRRIVFLSSAAVYGFEGEGRVSERAQLRPLHGYERALLAEEKWLRAVDRPEVVVLRAAQGFGPDEPVSARLFAWLVAGGVALPRGGRAPRTFLAGPDLGRAFLAAAIRGQPGMAYLLGGIEGSWHDLLLAAAATLRLRGLVRRSSYDLAYLGAWSRLARRGPGPVCWPTPYVVDLLARPLLVEDGWSRRELSWSPQVVTLEAGLAELPDWHQAMTLALEPGAATWPDPAERRLSS